jgi:hypothetical protein
MHTQVMQFASIVRELTPNHFANQTVLDFGSLNINGSIRPLFENCTFTGIDWRSGPDVDIVSLAHEYNGQEVDIVISTEMLEHDPYWEKSLVNMVYHIKKGGMLLISCANDKRPAHCVETAPVNNYYQGIHSLEIHRVLSKFKHSFLVVINNELSNDVYAVMIK